MYLNPGLSFDMDLLDKNKVLICNKTVDVIKK